MRSGIVGIVLIYLVLAVIEVMLHWYMGTQESASAHWMRETYLYKDSLNGKKYIAGLVDLVIPAILLGIVTGSIGSRLNPPGLACCVLALSLGLVALFPVYAALLPNSNFVWWGETYRDRAAGLMVVFLEISILCGVFTYGSRLLIQYYQHPHA